MHVRRVDHPAAAGPFEQVLVNELCDLVRVHTVPGHTTIRVYGYLSDRHT